LDIYPSAHSFLTEIHFSIEGFARIYNTLNYEVMEWLPMFIDTGLSTTQAEHLYGIIIAALPAGHSTILQISNSVNTEASDLDSSSIA